MERSEAVTAADVRYVHAGDLSTADAHKLVWNEGNVADRYQELAIVGDRVIGSWQYTIEWKRKRAHIDSSHTGVSYRYRGRGVARALWMRGITRWKPARIQSTIGTDEGRNFLARMTAWLAYASPETFLWVKRRPEDREHWEMYCANAAHELLRKLGDADRATKLKKLAEKKPLQLVQGATS